jgi:glycosyltransferase involved in cell wall biosynthesis
VIDDTGNSIDSPHTWVKLLHTDGLTGAGHARNVGIDNAKGEFIVFLDADDLLLPEFLAESVKAYKRSGRYVYTSWYGQRGKVLTESQASEYSQDSVLAKSSIHAITSLIPKVWIDDVGGFNEDMISWEDSDFFMKLAVSGYCGKRLNKPLFIYNYHSGSRRELGVKYKPELAQEINQNFEHYRNGSKAMCACDDKLKKTPLDFTSDIESGEMIRVEMFSGSSAKVHIVGNVTKTTYGRRQKGDIFYMYIEDAKAQSNIFQPVGNAPLQLSKTELPSSKPKRLVR